MVAEDVSELAVFDDKSKSWIQYESLSDALIAKLRLETHTPTCYTDAFLRILNNPQFDAQKVSFQTSMDIDRSVAEAQLSRMSQRTSACTGYPSTHLPRLSHDIFALIVDAIVQERPPLTDNPLSHVWEIHSRRVLVSERLKALALTHRTITPLAQRALGQRLIVSELEHPCALTRSPLLGPWTTELVIWIRCSTGGDYTTKTPDELLNYISAVLQRTPELKFLYINTPEYEDRVLKGEALCIGRLLKVIRLLGRLETLWWIVPAPKPYNSSECFTRLDIEDVCCAVNKMPHLRKLVLRNVNRGWIELDGCGDGEERTHHLEELCLAESIRPAGPLETHALSWLMNGPQLQSLTVELGTNRESLESILMASPVLLRLHTIHLKFLMPPAPDVLSRIFASSTASSTSCQTPTQKSVLHTLQLTLSASLEWTEHQIMSTYFDLSYIPCSVRSLQLHLLHISQPELDRALCLEQEFRLILSIKNRRNMLKEFKITRTEYNYRHPWNRLARLCKSQGCQLKVTRKT